MDLDKKLQEKWEMSSDLGFLVVAKDGKNGFDF
jgi:hypothetical protein